MSRRAGATAGQLSPQSSVLSPGARRQARRPSLFATLRRQKLAVTGALIVGFFALVALIGPLDYPVVQCATLVISVLFVLVSLVVDILYAVVDPRLRTT